MPKRNSRSGKPARDSDSDTDSCDERSQKLDTAQYAWLELATALLRPADYVAAVTELAALLRDFYPSGCEKPVQAAMVEDVNIAIDSCDGLQQSCAALAALMEAAERHLPQAKRGALQRRYRQVVVHLRRRARRRCGGADGSGDGSSDEEEAEPATFAALPMDVVEQVFRYLDPITLARAACVGREWRAAACKDELWQPHCAAVLGRRQAAARAVGTAAAAPHSGQASSSDGGGLHARHDSRGGGGYRHLFFRVARQHPDRLLRWRTNRVLLAGRRLAWLPAGQPPPPSARHISTAGVLALCRSGGRRAGTGSSGGGSSDSEASEGGSEGSGGVDGASRRLRFWQL